MRQVLLVRFGEVHLKGMNRPFFLKKLTENEDLLDAFKRDPIKVVEKLIGVDLPNDQVEKLVEGIKAKIDLDKLGSALGGLFGKK